MHRLIACAVFSLIIISCGREHAYVAEQVKYRVFFKDQSTQVSFVLAPTYQIKTNIKYNFQNQGALFIRWDDINSSSEIGSKVRSTSTALREPIGQTLIEKLPGNRDLPNTVPGSKIFMLSEKREAFTSHLLYSDFKGLVIGGGLVHSQFSKLPKNFFGTQKFYSSNGDTEGTISILGPSENFEGGIFFFGNFGSNPFSEPQALLESAPPKEWRDIDLQAKAPMVISSLGEKAPDILKRLKVEDFMSELNSELQKSAPGDSDEQEYPDL